MKIAISILDQSPIYPGTTASDALAQTVQLAQKAEELEFHRFWVSEHHDSEFLAGSSPEVLISYLLARTERIRIGSGGIMLQHYSPYKVAENFNVLASLAPGRVDLGVGRAPGGLPRSTQALQQGNANSKSLTEKLIELEAYVNNRTPEDLALAGLKATPHAAVPADLYLLGASLDSALLAASLGLAYVFSLSINGDKDMAVEAIQAYRTNFQPICGRSPQALLALSVIVADTDQEAEELVGDKKQYKVYLSSGNKVTVGTLAQAEEFGRQAGEPYTIEEKEMVVTRGSKETVRKQLLSLQEQTGVCEFIITTRIGDAGMRLRSLEQLKEALNEIEGGIPVSYNDIQAYLNTHDLLIRAVQGLDHKQLTWKAGAASWSVTEVLAHLADHSIVISFRIRDILAGTTVRLPAFDQDAWVSGQKANEGDAADILAAFEQLLRYNSLLFKRLSEEDWHRSGINAKGDKVRVTDIIQGFVKHVNTHLNQIERIKRSLAAQSGQEVISH